MKVSPRPEPLVKHWFDVLPLKVQAPVHELCALVQACDEELLRGVHWGNLVFSYRGRALLAISTHRTHVNLQVFNGTLLLPRFPMLLGSDKQAKHLKCRLGEPINAELVQNLVCASLRLASTRVPHFQEPEVAIQAPVADAACGWGTPTATVATPSARPPVVISRVNRRRIVLPNESVPVMAAQSDPQEDETLGRS